MSVSRLAQRYAKSVLDLAVEKDLVDEVLADVRGIRGTISANRELEVLLKSPIVSPDKKLEIIKIIFADRVHFILMEFMEILVRKRREGFLPEMCDSFLEQYNEMHGIKPVRVTTAVPIPEELQQRIANSLRTPEVTDIDLEIDVDPDLIGGYILQYDDKLYDASVARNLHALRQDFRSNIYVKKY